MRAVNAIDIISQILRDQSDRVMKYGSEHAFSFYVVSPEEYLAIEDECRRSCRRSSRPEERLPDQEIRIHMQTGPREGVKIIKGPA